MNAVLEPKERGIVYYTNASSQYGMIVCEDSRKKRIHVDLTRFAVSRGQHVEFTHQEKSMKRTVTSLTVLPGLEIEKFKMTWFDVDRGFGLYTDEAGKALFLHKSVVIDYNRFVGVPRTEFRTPPIVQGARHTIEKGDIIFWISSVEGEQSA